MGAVPINSTFPKPLTKQESVLPQPEKILAARTVQKGSYRPRPEVLVKWDGALEEDATWENRRRFLKAFPHFILEDKYTL